jgi:pyruvate dehydrogenase E2 component (dihydrolipoamide acetyltransferase)
MVKQIIVPQIGQDIESGKLVDLNVKVGDFVKKGDLVAAVESDKATFEIEAFESGYVIQVLNTIGDEVKVLSPIVYLGEKDEAVNSQARDVINQEMQDSVPVQDVGDNKKIKDLQNKIKASPLARRIAKENKIDYMKIRGTGPNGRIIKNDVLEELSKKAGDAVAEQTDLTDRHLSEPDQKITMTKMRLKIRERLEKSKKTIPHFYLYKSVDMTQPLELSKAYNKTSSLKISINDIIIRATTQALLRYPRLNSYFIDNEIIQKGNINIGIAVSVEDGLLVPVIENADKLTITEIGKISKDLSTAARKGVIKSEAVGTFTISNLGMYGIDLVFPIINPPECAILGVGAVEQRVVPLENNTIGIRDKLMLSLACDHRIIDGVYGSQFLIDIKDQLENISF